MRCQPLPRPAGISSKDVVRRAAQQPFREGFETLTPRASGVPPAETARRKVIYTPLNTGRSPSSALIALAAPPWRPGPRPPGPARCFPTSARLVREHIRAGRPLGGTGYPDGTFSSRPAVDPRRVRQDGRRRFRWPPARRRPLPGRGRPLGRPGAPSPAGAAAARPGETFQPNAKLIHPGGVVVAPCWCASSTAGRREGLAAPAGLQRPGPGPPRLRPSPPHEGAPAQRCSAARLPLALSTGGAPHRGVARPCWPRASAAHHGPGRHRPPLARRERGRRPPGRGTARIPGIPRR